MYAKWLEALPDCFGVFSARRDAAGNIVDFTIEYLNPAACRNNRRTLEEQIGRGLLELMPAHRDTGLFDAYVALLHSGEPLQREQVVYEDDYAGTRLKRCFDIRATCTGPDEFAASWRDVTGEREHRERLRWQAELLNQASEAAFVWQLNGGIHYWNKSAERLYGYSAEEAFGQRSHDLLATRSASPTGEIERALLETGSWQGELEHRTKDGRWIAVEVHMSRLGDDGNPVVLETARDISQRKRAEQDLIESEARLRRAIMVSPLPIMIHAEDGEVVTVNHAWTSASGYTHAHIPNIERWLELAYGAQREAPSAVIRELYGAQAETRDGEFEIRTLEGEVRVWDFSSAPLGRDARGRRLTISVAHDVTERMRVQNALHEADRRKDEFLAMLGHELRNPLGPIRNAAEILKAESGNSRVAKVCGIIDRQLEHMVRIVDDLLDVSRIARASFNLHLEECSLSEIVTNAVHDYESTFRDAGIRLLLELEPSPLRVHADCTRLTQALGNLLHNAQKFTSAGGEVVVRLQGKPPGEAVISVRDSGIGMSADILGRVFDPFSQADRSLDRSGGGLGLGLALVKGIAELHGGSVTATSPGVGRGSEFTIRLPVPDAPGARAEALPQPQSKAKIARRRVVLIEDNVDAAEMMRMLLELWGHDVHVAHNGEQGLELVRSARPDIVFCDIGLPGDLDGYQVARQLRSSLGELPILLVALTGYGQEEDQRRALEAGFHEHLVKPVQPEKVHALLAQSIR